MKNLKDYKSIIIIVLLIVLALSYIFRSTGGGDNYEDEIEKLHIENDSLLKSISEKELKIIEIEESNKKIQVEINDLNKINETLKGDINKLKGKRNEAVSNINRLDNDGLVQFFTGYLEGK